MHSTPENFPDRIGGVSDSAHGEPRDLKTKISIYSIAEQEYTESLSWYAERSIDTAREFDREFDLALTTISSNPERFPHCDERHQFYLMQKFPFQIIYRQVTSEVHVVAVAHTARKPNYWSER